MSLSMSPVTFHGDTIFCATYQNQPYTAMKPIIENMGLDWRSQQRKLSGCAERWGVVIMTIPSSSGDQQTLCMPVRKLPAFLNTINPKKVRPELRERVELYQAESDEALWEYWTKQQNQNEAQVLNKPKRKAKPKPALPPLPDVFTDGPISIGDVAEILNMLAYRMEQTCHTMTEKEWKAGTEFFFHAAKTHSPDAVTHFRITNALSATLVGPLFTTRSLVRAAATMAENAQKMHDIVCSFR